jgi:hypothetical protein
VLGYEGGVFEVVTTTGFFEVMITVVSSTKEVYAGASLYSAGGEKVCGPVWLAGIFVV